jgi:hypothetical protein
MTPLGQFMELAFLAGGKYRERIEASAITAMAAGASPQYVLECLLRNRPEFFDKTLARKRQKANGGLQQPTRR